MSLAEEATLWENLWPSLRHYNCTCFTGCAFPSLALITFASSTGLYIKRCLTQTAVRERLLSTSEKGFLMMILFFRHIWLSESDSPGIYKGVENTLNKTLKTTQCFHLMLNIFFLFFLLCAQIYLSILLWSPWWIWGINAFKLIYPHCESLRMSKRGIFLKSENVNTQLCPVW